MYNYLFMVYTCTYTVPNGTFKYERNGINYKLVIDKYEFIHSIIKHILDENFKMIRYYGTHVRGNEKEQEK